MGIQFTIDWAELYLQCPPITRQWEKVNSFLSEVDISAWIKFGLFQDFLAVKPPENWKFMFFCTLCLIQTGSRLLNNVVLLNLETVGYKTAVAFVNQW